jgi:hypothetical protein
LIRSQPLFAGFSQAGFRGRAGSGGSQRRVPSRRLFGIVALNYRLPGFFDRAIVSGNFINPKQQ